MLGEGQHASDVGLGIDRDRRARAELAAAHAAAITARVRLAQLTGELSLDWLAQAVEDVP